MLEAGPVPLKYAQDTDEAHELSIILRNYRRDYKVGP